MFSSVICSVLSFPLVCTAAETVNVEENTKKFINKTPYMEIEYYNEDGKQRDRIEFELFWDDAPKSSLNFATLLAAPKTEDSYANTTFHRIIPNFMMQGGDFTHHNGRGGRSIYGETFDDEKFVHKHEKGVLSMANRGKDTNGSQFFITFEKQPHLDGKHVVFGRVKGEDGLEILKKIEKVSTKSNDVPAQPVKIVECGFKEDKHVENADEEVKEERVSNDSGFDDYLDDSSDYSTDYSDDYSDMSKEHL